MTKFAAAKIQYSIMICNKKYHRCVRCFFIGAILVCVWFWQLSSPEKGLAARPKAVAKEVIKVQSGSSKIMTETNSTHMYIHVGPVKTGSSSIQCNLQANKHLEHDSYVFLGKKERQCNNYQPLPHREYINAQQLVFGYFSRGWLKQVDKNHVFQNFVNDWRDEMDKRNSKGLDTIISAEEFCGLREISHNDERAQLFVDFLQGSPQIIKFQIVYRDYFDWVVSIHNFDEWFSASANKRLDIFQGHRMSSIIDSKYIHSVSASNESGLDNGASHFGCSPYNMWLYLESIMPLFRKDKASIDVLNIFHGDGDIGTKYICSLPHTTYACNETRKMNFGTSRPTPINTIHADRIAAAAWAQCLFYNASAVKSRRKDVTQAISEQVRIHQKELPMECLGEIVLGQLLQTSIRIGKEMLGSDYDVEVMKEKFENFVARKKFCSINVTAVLMEESWRIFLQKEDIF